VNKLKFKLILLGVFLILLGLWGGSWLISALPNDYRLASFMTGFLHVLVGAYCVITTINED
jgi:hypothetical protein